jgi:hypothetical protein
VLHLLESKSPCLIPMAQWLARPLQAGAGGDYEFGGLPPGEYTVMQVNPADYPTDIAMRTKVRTEMPVKIPRAPLLTTRYV